jgi:hypothetical protein
MFSDLTVPLDETQQKIVTAWTVKMAMVVDSVQGRNPANRFYTRDECVNMRLNRAVPERTRIWIGRSALSPLSAIGTHIGVFTPKIPAKTPGMVVNIVVGHLAIQIFTLHVHPEHNDQDVEDPQPKPGHWENMLVPIWPITLQNVTWLPKVTFTNGGKNSIATLLDRWRIGNNVS